MLRTLSDAVVPLADRRNLVIAGAITAFLLLALPFELFVKPLARQFRLSDPYISHPLANEHVPVPLLAFLAVIVPLVFITVPGAINKRYSKHSAVSVLGLLLSISATMLVADVLKWVIGNQRPDFIARCQPRPDIPKDRYVTVEVACTNPNMAKVWEGCRSTPSGHSSLSFAGLGFLSLWIFFTFEINRKDRPLYAKVLVLAPLVIAGFVAYTRIIDHKHHWIDIIFGSLLGCASAYCSYIYAIADSKPEKPERDVNVA